MHFEIGIIETDQTEKIIITKIRQKYITKKRVGILLSFISQLQSSLRSFLSTAPSDLTFQRKKRAPKNGWTQTTNNSKSNEAIKIGIKYFSDFFLES